ncbi:MAG: hypothetical protein U5N55_07625 [Cypionkella sp.]|nr:hypothetical protein [Cypionkella sp.]
MQTVDVKMEPSDTILPSNVGDQGEMFEVVKEQTKDGKVLDFVLHRKNGRVFG